MSTKKSNGEGNIIKRKDGRLMGRVTVGRDTDGKLLRKSVYANSKADLIKKMDEVKRELFLGLYISPEKTLVKEWFAYWLIHFKKVKLKPTTYDCYEKLINSHLLPKIGNLTLQNLTLKDIQSAYNKIYESGLTAKTVRKIHNILKPSLKQAISEGHILKNPAEFVELPEMIRTEIKAFSNEEQTTFEESSKSYRLHTAFIFNLDTGLRTCEILALDWKDIDLELGEVKINKNIVLVKDRSKENGNKLIIQPSSKTKYSTRKIPLTTRCITILTQLKLKQPVLSDIVFCSQTGGYITPRNYARTFQKSLKMTEIETCSPHTMRHSFATRLFERGVPAKTISQLLGHASVSFTLDTYTHVLPDTKKDAIKLLEN